MLHCMFWCQVLVQLVNIQVIRILPLNNKKEYVKNFSKFICSYYILSNLDRIYIGSKIIAYNKKGKKSSNNIFFEDNTNINFVMQLKTTVKSDHSGQKQLLFFSQTFVLCELSSIGKKMSIIIRVGTRFMSSYQINTRLPFSINIHFVKS